MTLTEATAGWSVELRARVRADFFFRVEAPFFGERPSLSFFVPGGLAPLVLSLVSEYNYTVNRKQISPTRQKSLQVVRVLQASKNPRS